MLEKTIDKSVFDERHGSDFKIRAVIIWALFLVIGLFFRFNHYPGGAFTIIFTSAGLQAYCFNGVLSRKNRNALNITLSVMGWVWFGVFVWGVFFNNGNPYGIGGLNVYGIVAVVYFVIYYLLSARKKIE